MSKVVDSAKEMLPVNDLIEIAIQNMNLFDNVNVHKNLRLAAVVAEFDQPNVIVYRAGNTLFEVIPTDKRSAYFKAFNADTARNFLNNSYEFIRWAKEEEDLKVLVTAFKDKNLLHLFKMISMNPPYEGMGYKVFNMKSGQIRVFLNLGV